jgi:hypothetical protein
VTVECPSVSFARPDVAVDRLVTDAEHPESAEPSADLVWTEVFS